MNLLPLTRVMEASLTATQTRQHLEEQIDAALLGERDDPDALDASILHQRRARWQMIRALGAWGRWHQSQAGREEVDVLERRTA